MFQERSRTSNILAGCVLLVAASAMVTPLWAASRRDERSVAELLALAKKRSAFSVDRAGAIQILSAQRDVEKVRDQRVVEALLGIAQRKDGDLIVRITCIEALGRLQYTLFSTDQSALKKYVEPFTVILKNRKQDPLVRTAIAKVFGKTLSLESFAEEKAFQTMLDIALDKNRNAALKMREKLMLRQACVEAAGKTAKGKMTEKALTALSNILVQVNIESLLKESVVRAFSSLLSRLNSEESKQIRPATVNILAGVVENKKLDVEIRSAGMMALARLARAGVPGVGGRVMDVIKRVLAKAENEMLLVAAVEALGITGNEAALPALKKAYTDMYQAANPKNPPDVHVRDAIMKTLGRLLDAQRKKRPAPNADAVQTMALMLTRAIDPLAKRKEVPEVIHSAIISMCYLNPTQKAFEAQHRRALETLLLLARKTKDEALLKTIAKTLTFIAREDFGTGLGWLERWEHWFDKKYPGIRIRRKAALRK